MKWVPPITHSLTRPLPPSGILSCRRSHSLHSLASSTRYSPIFEHIGPVGFIEGEYPDIFISIYRSTFNTGHKESLHRILLPCLPSYPILRKLHTTTMSLRSTLQHTLKATARSHRGSNAIINNNISKASFSVSTRHSNTEAPPSNSAGKTRYDYKDALRIESSLLTEDEVAIKWV